MEKYRIFKYKIPITCGEFELRLPFNSRVLNCTLQGSFPFIWVQFEALEEHNLRTQKFLLVWTGEEFSLNNAHRYIGTFQIAGTVYHLYENF